MDFSAVRASIPGLDRHIYLNSGASAPSPRPVLDAAMAYLKQQAEDGPFSLEMLREELRIETALRAAVAALLKAAPAEITLCANTTDALNLVIAGVDWRPGDQVITCDQEHASGLLPWYLLRDRVGIELRIVPLPADGHGVAERITAQITDRTRLICLSHVSWATGLRLPMEEITRQAHAHGVAVLVDGAQGPGHLPVDVRTLGVDFYGLSSQKWLMGPHGAGALYMSSSALWQPFPTRPGWASGPFARADGAYQLWPDGRRYECATSNHAVLAGFLAALQFYQANGPQAVWDRILSLSQFLVDQLQSVPGVTLLSPRDPDQASGLVSFTLEGRDAKEVSAYLAQAHHIIARPVEPAAVRLSTHIFNTEEELSAVVGALRELAAGATASPARSSS